MITLKKRALSLALALVLLFALAASAGAAGWEPEGEWTEKTFDSYGATVTFSDTKTFRLPLPVGDVWNKDADPVLTGTTVNILKKGCQVTVTRNGTPDSAELEYIWIGDDGVVTPQPATSDLESCAVNDEYWFSSDGDSAVISTVDSYGQPSLEIFVYENQLDKLLAAYKPVTVETSNYTITFERAVTCVETRPAYAHFIEADDHGASTALDLNVLFVRPLPNTAFTCVYSPNVVTNSFSLDMYMEQAGVSTPQELVGLPAPMSGMGASFDNLGRVRQDPVGWAPETNIVAPGSLDDGSDYMWFYDRDMRIAMFVPADRDIPPVTSNAVTVEGKYFDVTVENASVTTETRKVYDYFSYDLDENDNVIAQHVNTGANAVETQITLVRPASEDTPYTCVYNDGVLNPDENLSEYEVDYLVKTYGSLEAAIGTELTLGGEGVYFDNAGRVRRDPMSMEEDYCYHEPGWAGESVNYTAIEDKNGGLIIFVPQDHPIPEPVSFPDVTQDWQTQAVEFVYANDLMYGTSGTDFSPNDYMTLGMALTVMARVSGVDTSSSDPWYKAGFDWAAEKGIHSGGSNTDIVERQDLILMLWKLAGSPDADLSALDKFPDAASVRADCRTAVAWSAQQKIMNGTDKGAEPSAPTTRAMYATFIMRAYELF